MFYRTHFYPLNLLTYFTHGFFTGPTYFTHLFYPLILPTDFLQDPLILPTYFTHLFEQNQKSWEFELNWLPKLIPCNLYLKIQLGQLVDLFNQLVDLCINSHPTGIFTFIYVPTRKASQLVILLPQLVDLMDQLVELYTN